MKLFLALLLLAVVPNHGHRIDQYKRSSKGQAKLSQDDAVFAEAPIACTDYGMGNGALEEGFKYEKLDGVDPRETEDITECKIKCSEIPGCTTFSFEDTRKGCKSRFYNKENGMGCCHFQGKTATKQKADKFIAGKPFCKEYETRTDCTCAILRHVISNAGQMDRNYKYNCEVHMALLPWQKSSSNYGDGETWAKCTSESNRFNPLSKALNFVADAWESKFDGEVPEKNDFECICGNYYDPDDHKNWDKMRTGELLHWYMKPKGNEYWEPEPFKPFTLKVRHRGIMLWD